MKNLSYFIFCFIAFTFSFSTSANQDTYLCMKNPVEDSERLLHGRCMTAVEEGDNGASYSRCVTEEEEEGESLTLEQCIQGAQDNYPLIKKYGLLSLFTALDLSEINKGWLPRVGVYGQLTGQNVVPSYPEALSKVLEQMGQDVKGLGKIQYKIGVDISQPVWDGGVSKVNREMVRSRQVVRRASLDVEMYSIRERVENIYFAILLAEKHISQNKVTYNLLLANLEKMRSMLKNGVAMKSDVDMVEAEMLSLKQQILKEENNVAGYRGVLEIFTGEKIGHKVFKMPQAIIPLAIENNRPELKLLDYKLSFNMLSDKLAKAKTLPKVSFFAQAYYGYPGFDYFKSMMSRDLSFNIMAGLKVTWNIDSFYTKKDSHKKTALNEDDIRIERDNFLFNTRLQTATQMKAIEGIREVMKEDSKIIELRSSIRKSAESQLENGVIDATALLKKISDENLACLISKLHEIQYIQEIYKLKYILNL